MIFSMFMPYNHHDAWDIRKENNVLIHLHNIPLRRCITRFNEMPNRDTGISESTHRMQAFSLERVS